jgi:protein-S-isoprenylcysteine O-methyltransferase
LSVEAASFWSLAVAWRLLEAWHALRMRRAGATGFDDPTGRWITFATWLGPGLGIVLAALGVPPRIPLSGSAAYGVALVLLIAGAMLRAWSIAALGAHFTRKLTPVGATALITAGPYRYVRHPSYTGALLGLIAVGLALGTFLALLCAAVPYAVALRWRIAREEAILRERFSDEFEAYRGTTGSLIPRMR